MVCLSAIATDEVRRHEDALLHGHHAMQCGTVLAAVNAAPRKLTSGIDRGCAQCRSQALTRWPGLLPNAASRVVRLTPKSHPGSLFGSVEDTFRFATNRMRSAFRLTIDVLSRTEPVDFAALRATRLHRT
jgi:hypothetical protein